MIDTPKEAATGDKAARDLMLSELLQVCTPAPWLLQIDDGFWVNDAYVRADKWGAIARVGISYSLAHWDVPQRANAKLIALAPTIAAELIKERAVNAKLLEACKLWVHYDSSDEEDSVTMMLNYADALETSKAAIKQAEEL